MQTTDVWHNPTVSATERQGDENKGGRQTQRQRGIVTVCSSLTDSVMIRGICSFFVSELPLCSSDPYDSSSGSLQLISIKPMVAQPNYSHPASSDRSQDSAIVNGEVMHLHTSSCRDTQIDLDTNIDTNKHIFFVNFFFISVTKLGLF